MEKIYGDLVQFTEFMPSVDFSLHQYLLMGDEAILIHTGTLNYSKELIPKLKEVLDGKNLKYIYVSHFESENLRGNRVLGQLFSMGMQLPIRCFMSVGSVFMLQFCGGWDVVS